MKIYVYPADFYGCGHYRAIWPTLVAQNVVDTEIEVILVPPDSLNGLFAVRDANGDVFDVTCPRDADAIIVQRPSYKPLAQGIPLMREKGIAVIVDIDDDLAAVHPSNPAWTVMHPRSVGRGVEQQSWQWVTSACKNATLVTVSTPALLKRYRGALPSVVLENCIPESYLDVPRIDSELIGWAGSTHSHPEDLKPLGPTIRQLGERGHDFLIVGNGEDSAKQLNLRTDPPCTGNIEFEKWISAVSQLGVGLAPLADTRFNEAKSWLKPLEYSVAGVPWIASPRAEYARFQALGAGLLANRPRDWDKVISRVLASPELRADLSGQGKELASRWTIERRIERWLDAWSSAVHYERELKARRTTSNGKAGTSQTSR